MVNGVARVVHRLGTSIRSKRRTRPPPSAWFTASESTSERPEGRHGLDRSHRLCPEHENHFEVHLATAKATRRNWATTEAFPHRVGNTGTEGRAQGKQSSSWGKNEMDEGSTVRCRSKEPANPHNPNTTHTPITYVGHKTTKHARPPSF